MKSKPVIISLSAVAADEERRDDTLSLITAGELVQRDGGVLLRYEESVDESVPPQQVELCLEKDSVSMTRKGDYETKLMFRKGQRYESAYHTPEGVLGLAVYCTRLQCRLAPTEGELALQYQLDLGGHFVAMHDMTLRYRTRDA